MAELMHRRRSYRRTLIAALACTATTAAMAVVGTGSVRAQDAFNNGVAKAHGQVMRISPGVGNLELAVTGGEATAEVVNSLAQAEAKTLDLGLIGSSLVAEQCDGSPSDIKERDLPQSTQVDNRDGDAEASADSFPIAEGALGGGRQTAMATTTPSAQATVSGMQAVLGPLATLSGGRSSATTRIVDGAAREAVATASADIDIAGVVSLRGMQWRAFHRTGADPGVEGTFSVEGANAGAAALPTELDALQEALNTALVPSGITVEMPRVEHLTEPNELIRVTPLRITLKDSPLGQTTVGAGLNLTRQQRADLFDALVGVYCRFADVLLVGDIAISAVAGTGFLIVEVGGVQATTADVVAGNPFGDAPAAGFGAPPPVQPAADGAGAPAAVASPGDPPPAPASPGGGDTAATAPIAATDGALERFCESIHPNGGGCTTGATIPVGLAGVALTAGVALLDWRQRRRVLDGDGAPA